MNAIAQSIQGFGSVRVVVLGVVGVLLLGIFGLLSMRLASPIMSPLYSNLAQDDANVIVTELGSMGVDFEIAKGGSELLVKSSDVLRVRMMLAQKGLPSQGSIVGYEVFDKTDSFGTSTFVHNVNLIRALEGELGCTIASLASIKSARVHLVIPKQSLFQKQKVEPSASVVITLNNRNKMPREETGSIKHLVSSAVPGPKLSRITVVDSSGKLLSRGSSDEDDMGGISTQDANEYQVAVERKYKKTIEQLLEKVVGIDKVRAEVSTEINFDRLTTNEETYDPDSQVARSVSTTEEIEESSEGGAGGAVSVANNLPEGGADTSSGGGASNSAERVDSVTNFEISKRITSLVKETGTIEKVSVAVLVDGRYEEDEENETRTYIPRTDEEIAQLRALVEKAIGYNQERGDSIEILNMQFTSDMQSFIAEEGAFDWLKRDLSSIIKTVMVGIVAILAILLVIRPLVNRAFEISQSDLDHEAMAAQAAEVEFTGGEEIDLDVIQTKVESSPLSKVNDIVENNPDETLTVIRNWLAQKG